MRLIRGIGPVALLLHGLAVVAVAGVVHIVTVFRAPALAKHDAFDRVAASAPVNAISRLSRPASDDAAPFRDPSMAAAVCRYDLSRAPLRITVDPIDQRFVSLGMHSRKGLAFYGLVVRSTERSPISMLVLTAAQNEETSGDDEPSRDLRIVAPEQDGFVLIETPAGDAGATTLSDQTLARVRCEAASSS
jgi:uncharacterized membrane protein